MSALGSCYQQGIGVEKNEEMAFYYIEKAANLGHLLAIELLARYYLNGYGVEKDEKNLIKEIYEMEVFLNGKK